MPATYKPHTILWSKCRA